MTEKKAIIKLNDLGAMLKLLHENASTNEEAIEHLDKAIKCFEKALELNPRDQLSTDNLKEALELKGPY
jgi:tetratricopeptide (TPR) repeat protein